MRIGKTVTGAAAGALGLAMGLVADFEGLRHEAYLDPVGIPTICYGHTAGVKLGQTATQEECDALLAAELGEALATVDALVTVPLLETREAALGSFVYNVGAPAFEGSTLLRKLNAGDVVGACDQLLRWVYANGKKLAGLERRRAAERALCLVGTR